MILREVRRRDVIPPGSTRSAKVVAVVMAVLRGRRQSSSSESIPCIEHNCSAAKSNTNLRETHSCFRIMVSDPFKDRVLEAYKQSLTDDHFRNTWMLTEQRIGFLTPVGVPIETASGLDRIHDIQGDISLLPIICCPASVRELTLKSTE